MMKLIGLTFALLLLGESIALAACPPDKPYNCVQQPNGKMRCGCGVIF
jgi:hypothetical protein